MSKSELPKPDKPVATDNSVFEYVAPSGAFIAMRRWKWRDALGALSADVHEMYLRLATATATVDGVSLSVAQWGDMDFDDALPLWQEIGRRMSMFNKARGIG